MSTSRTRVAAAAALSLTALSLTAASLTAGLALATPAGAAPSGDGPRFHVYVSDVYGADLAACRDSARKGTAWRIRGLVDAGAATRSDIIGGLVVSKDGNETSNRWLSGKTAAGQARSGSVVVPRSGNWSVFGFVGIDGAGDSFTKAPAAIKAC